MIKNPISLVIFHAWEVGFPQKQKKAGKAILLNYISLLYLDLFSQISIHCSASQKKKKTVDNNKAGTLLLMLPGP